MAEKTQKQETEKEKLDQKPKCGIIMPISAIDSCSGKHWEDVLKILREAIEMAGYDANLVSNSDDSGVIQKRIVENIYNNEIIVCDVSCKNANVMFELGMRLAFDKPTIIVIDDKTSYSFDTAPIEHLSYPRDLNYYQIKDFQEKLKDKIVGTIEASKQEDYTTFLKNFGTFEIAKIESRKGDINAVVLDRIDEISSRMRTIETMIVKNRPETDLEPIISRFCNENNITIERLAANTDIIDELVRSVFFDDPSVRRRYGNPMQLDREIRRYLANR